MPLYEYECLVCGCHFERFQGFTEPPPQECPHGHHGVRRVFSPPAIVFKGSGFYTTDYGGNGGGNKGQKSKERKKATKTEKAAD